MLVIKDIVAHYGRALALDHVNLEVPAKGLTAIIGPNGAGKTTLLKTISRIVNPTSGDVIFNGESLLKVPAHKLAKIGIAHCPEGRKPFRSMSVKDNLLMGGHARSSSSVKKQLDYVCDLFPILKERFHQDSQTLSGGEQQMMAMARALMMEPKLLLIDEPSLGLSPVMVDEVEKIVRSIKDANVPVLMVEGNIDLIMDLADLVYVFNHGQTMFSGSVADIKNDPELTKTYIGM